MAEKWKREYTIGESLALICANNYSQIDGAHHKAWVIDQMCKHILGDDYDRFVAEYKNGEDGLETYDWDTGIAP